MIFKNFKNSRENCNVNYTYCHVRVLSTNNINKKCEPQWTFQVFNIIRHHRPPQSLRHACLVHYTVAGLKTYSCSTTDLLLHSIKYKLFHCNTVPIGVLNIIYYNYEKTMELCTAVSSKITKVINFCVINKKRRDTRVLVTHLYLTIVTKYT